MTPERKQRLLTVLNKRQPDLTVVMENVFDPHNISAVMRTCDAVGVQDIYILNTQIPSHKKWGKSASSSAAKWLTIHQYSDTITCFNELRKQYDYIYTTKLSHHSLPLHKMDFTQRIALVFGNERDGVSEQACQLADGNFIIPQTGLIQSLNISVACAITLYEAFRQKSAAGHYNQSRLPEPRCRQIKKQWDME